MPFRVPLQKDTRQKVMSSNPRADKVIFYDCRVEMEIVSYTSVG